MFHELGKHVTQLMGSHRLRILCDAVPSFFLAVFIGGVICCIIMFVNSTVDLQMDTAYLVATLLLELFLFSSLYLLRFVHLSSPALYGQIRFFVVLTRKYFYAFLSASIVFSVLLYLVFLYLLGMHRQQIDHQLAESSRAQIERVQKWMHRQVDVRELVAQGKRRQHGVGGGSPDRESVSSGRGKLLGKDLSQLPVANSPEMAETLGNLRVWLGTPSKTINSDGSFSTRLTLYVPYLRVKDGTWHIGVNRRQVDPGDSLVPLISSWPVMGIPTMTCLYAHQGNDVAVLYPLAEEGTHPGSHAWLVESGRAERGIFHEADRRGRRIVGYIDRIPDSGLGLMVSVDETDAYSPVRQLAILFLVTDFLASLMTIIVFVFILKHKRTQLQAERLRIGLRKKALHQHYDYLSRYANDVIILMDESGRVMEVNDRLESMFGRSRDALVGQHIETLFDIENGSDFGGKWNDLKKEKSLIFEARGLDVKGRIFPVEISSRVIETEGRQFVQFIIRDISEKKKVEEMVWRYANFDQITGLPNRRMFLERLFMETSKAQRSRTSVALMFLDLDHFKDVNDTMGHGAGDLLLMEAGRRLVQCVRETDTVARLGGDEFTVILPDVTDFTDVERVAKHILQRLSEPFNLEGKTVHVSASIGITFFPDDSVLTNDLMKNADQAMYAAKGTGGNQYHYFTPSMQEMVNQRMQMLSDMHLALENREFEMVFQPIADISSGRICRAESLIRWHHPKKGLIDPAVFVPLAEDAGLIQAFGDWIFMEAARRTAEIRKHIPDFQVSINISPAQFKKGGIDTAIWFSWLKELELSASAIVIEITERLLLEFDEGITRQLFVLRDAGIEVALDDFGTGYSSLAYLKKLEIDYLKIDQMFVRNLSARQEDRGLCEAMILMAHKLDIGVVAEGVETRAQLDILRSLDCDFAQGYYISPPLSGSRLMPWLLSRMDKQ